MAKVDPVYTNLPTSADVDYSPLGGKVGVEQSDIDNIVAVTTPEAITAMKDGIGPNGTSTGENNENAVLDHLRKRNLGLI
jgi:hypothetical protein